MKRAKRSRRPAKAVKCFVERNEWQVEAIREGVKAADAGQSVEHERVEAWLETWGTSDESKPPR